MAVGDEADDGRATGSRVASLEIALAERDTKLAVQHAQLAALTELVAMSLIEQVRAVHERVPCELRLPFECEHVVPGANQDALLGQRQPLAPLVERQQSVRGPHVRHVARVDQQVARRNADACFLLVVSLTQMMMRMEVDRSAEAGPLRGSALANGAMPSQTHQPAPEAVAKPTSPMKEMLPGDPVYRLSVVTELDGAPRTKA